MKKKLSYLLCAAMVASTLAGCGGSSQPKTEATTAAGTVAQGSEASGEDSGKILTYAISGEPETLDPTMNNYSTSSIILQNLFSGLYQLEADGSLTNAMCESYTVSDDGLNYVFTLKDGLKWSDGSPLTAADFEYSWKLSLIHI